jgi:hypothetical protein
MYYWTDISSSVTEAYEFFIKVGTRGVVLRPKTQEVYQAYIELEQTEQQWAKEPFTNLNAAKTWCEAQLQISSAPSTAYYIFRHRGELDTETELCFELASQPFNRYEAARQWQAEAGLSENNSRLCLMLERVPERFFEPREATGSLRFQF